MVEHRPPMRDLDIVFEDETCRQAYLGPIHIVAWFDAPTLEQMRAYGRHARSISERLPLTGLMSVIVRGRPNFDAAVRSEARRLTERGLHASTAHVIMATGLVGAAARAFVSTTVLLGRPKNPTRVFGALDPAAIWLGEAHHVEPGVLVDACRRIASF